jgi:antitoxin HicB
MNKTERQFTIVLHQEQDGSYSVMVPTLPGCFSQGRTFEEAVANAKEAIAVHVEGLLMDGEEVPEEGDLTLAVQVKVAA